MSKKKWIAVLVAIVGVVCLSVGIPAAAKTKNVCNRVNCTATGVHWHGNQKYRSSCRSAKVKKYCNRPSCNRTGRHKHNGITYSGCGHHVNHHAHSGGHH